MKAIVWTGYGTPEVLLLKNVEKPSPRANEVLIKIHATTVTAGDCEARSLDFQFLLALGMRAYVGLRKPKRIVVLGQELSGVIESVGKDVTLFEEGRKVFAVTGMSMGAYAEYICLPEVPKEMQGMVATMPENISFGEAAAVPVGGLEALHFLRQADIQRGQKVLIIGAGGSIGTFAVQLAKHLGADITAVDSGTKLDMLRSIGAVETIDYTKEDIGTRGNIYDVIFDIVGKSSLSRNMNSLSQNGHYLFANPRFSHMIRGRFASRLNGRKMVIGSAGRKIEDLAYLKELIEAGEIKMVIDSHYSLDEVADAHRYVETGLKSGNVVIDVVRA